MTLAAFALPAASAFAQKDDRAADAPPADMLRQVKELEEQAKRMGTWDRESQVIQEAHANLFARLNWTSESDQFALGLVNQISTIPPWEPKRREQVFLSQVQARLNLNGDQLNLVSTEMKRESIAVAMKHFRTLMPIVMEVAKTRAEGQPFTPEQVAKWSANLDPVLKDALEAVQRVSTKLEGTMDEQQKAILHADMEAVLHRHADVVEMVQEWKAGNWTPMDWGLDNDPIHAASIAEYAAREARRDALVEQKLTSDVPQIDPANEDEWDRYVRWFCRYYECDDKQVRSAESILKDCKQQAANYMARRGGEIERHERNAQKAQTDKRREYFAGEAAKLRKPIAAIFTDLCNRLERKVLTSEQLRKKPAATPPRQSAGAPRPAPKQAPSATAPVSRR